MSEHEEQHEEQITEGDTPAETDVQGQQGEVDWHEQPLSDARLSEEAQQRLGLIRP